jgi:putative hydroxymethylpyrimidine transport system substrate-binding protein
MRRRRFTALAGLAAALVLLAGAAPAGAADRLTVLLDWFVNPDHAPLVIAAERGEFAKAGLAVELVAPADPSAPPRLVAAGEADVAITYQPSLYQQAAEGLPVARFGTLVAQPLNSLVVLADGPVSTLADLRGRTIGYSVGGFEDALLARMLEGAGLGLADVTLVNVNFALSPALLAGRVDAVIGAFRNFELTQLRLEGKEGRAFLPEEHGVPAYDELIFIARRDALGDPRLPRFLDAVGAAKRFMRDSPAEAEAVFFRAHPELDDALNRQAYADTLAAFADDPRTLDRGRYEAFARFMTDAGLVTSLPPLDTYAVELD